MDYILLVFKNLLLPLLIFLLLLERFKFSSLPLLFPY
jgi:hypothetical protein